MIATQLVIGIVVALCIAGMVAPAEAIGWWRRGRLDETERPRSLCPSRRRTR